MSRLKKNTIPKYKIDWIVYPQDPTKLSQGRSPTWTTQMDQYRYRPCRIREITKLIDNTWAYKVSIIQRSVTHQEGCYIFFEDVYDGVDHLNEVEINYLFREEWLEEGELKNGEQIEQEHILQRVKGILNDRTGKE